MIIKEHQLKSIIEEKFTFLCMLIYGPNEGLVRDNINDITKVLTDTNEYEQSYFNAKDLDNDSQSLDDVIRSVSMFYKRKLIILDSLKDKHCKIIENILLDPPQQTAIIFKSENLSKSSKIRKLFETDAKCFALACYDDDYKSISKNIELFIKQSGLRIDRDIKNYLTQSLSDDRMISKHELEKIRLYYKDANQEIHLNEVKKLLNDSSSQNISKMNENVMYGKTSKSSKIINKLLSEGTSPISLVRSLINYIMRIHQTKVEMKKGNNFEAAIKSLKPPVFWKDKDNFQQHCNKWPLKIIEKELNQLLETEISCKLNSKLAGNYCEKSILLIANTGKKYFRV